MAEQVQRLLNIPAVVNQYLDGLLEPREAVVDIFTETMHFAGQNDVSIHDCIELARENYLEEKEES